jgi:hypothetical protein
MSDFFLDEIGGKSNPWLHKTSRRLLTLRLSNVSNPLDGDALWDSRTGADPKMLESSKRRHDLRLKQALHAHRFSKTVLRANTPVPRLFVFADVVVWINERIWENATINGNEDLFYMTERLYFQHREAFGRDPKEDHDTYYLGRSPHYSIMPSARLAEDEVICQFGQGVFLPNANDEQERTASIKIAKKGHTPSEPNEWVFFERATDGDGKEITPPQCRKVLRPAGLYSKQTMLLLGNRLENSALLSPLWINSTDEGVIIFNGGARVPEVYGDKIHIVSSGMQRRGQQTSCLFSACADNQDTLMLVLDRAEPYKTPSFDTDNGEVDDDESDLSGLTHIDMGDEVPDYTYTLQLTGIVLPKIGKTSPPVSHWLLNLNDHAEPVVEGEAPVWTIKANIEGELTWSMASEENWCPLDLTAPLPFPADANLHLESAELTEKQFAILPLKGISIPLSDEPRILGRDINEPNAAITPLGLLKYTSVLVYADGEKCNSLESLNLSAKHLQVNLKGESLHLKHFGKRSKTFITQKKSGIRVVLTEQECEADMDVAESILIGPFRFQFIETFRFDRQD